MHTLHLKSGVSCKAIIEFQERGIGILIHVFEVNGSQQPFTINPVEEILLYGLCIQINLFYDHM